VQTIDIARPVPRGTDRIIDDAPSVLAASRSRSTIGRSREHINSLAQWLHINARIAREMTGRIVALRVRAPRSLDRAFGGHRQAHWRVPTIDIAQD
jgi:hypothetical protein